MSLWDADKLEQDHLAGFEACKGACFSPCGKFTAATAARQSAALIFDLATQINVLTIDEPECEPCTALLDSFREDHFGLRETVYLKIWHFI